MDPPFARDETRSEGPGGRQLQPFQFSIATLMAVVTAYSVLFGLLSWAQVRSYSVFAAVVFYVTSMAFSQWSLFGGRHPYRASFLAGCLLSVAGGSALLLYQVLFLIAFASPSLFDVVLIFPIALLLGGILGLLVGGLVDITLLFIEVVGGIDRKLVVFSADFWSRLFPTAKPAKSDPKTRMLRAAVLALLVILFSVAVFMVNIEDSWRRP